MDETVAKGCLIDFIIQTSLHVQTLHVTCTTGTPGMDSSMIVVYTDTDSKVTNKLHVFNLMGQKMQGNHSALFY